MLDINPRSKRRSTCCFLGLIALIALAAASCQKSDAPAAPAASATAIITTTSGIEMAVIPAGWLEMGSAAGQPDEAPVHKVWIDPFLMDTTPVTQDQYAALMVVNPSHFKGGRMPVEQISWAKAAVYCNKRSEAEGLDPCYDDDATCHFEASGYRLPTEAEWEYACRAGAGADGGWWRERPLSDIAWFIENSAKSTHPVGEKRANPWGLSDMLGNVAEWCNDVYDENYYNSSPDLNPRGPADGKRYVLRGGSWAAKAESCRPTARAAETPGFQDACFARDTIGFRCVRRVSAKEAPGTPLSAVIPSKALQGRVEESRCADENKARFLDSLRSLGMTMLCLVPETAGTLTASLEVTAERDPPETCALPPRAE
jgi:formylglycine-generating enzyme required for sulfatase activity